jgi:hypothetical protein
MLVCGFNLASKCGDRKEVLDKELCPYDKSFIEYNSSRKYYVA